MSHFDVVLLALTTLIERSAHRLSLVFRFLQPFASVGGFFGNLYGQLTLFAGAMTVFFFALAALFYGASIIMSSERARSHAIASIYGALIGLALALLAGTAAGIVSSAASGQ